MSECGNVKDIIKNFVNNPAHCGFGAFVVTKNTPRLKRIQLSEDQNHEERLWRQLSELSAFCASHRSLVRFPAAGRRSITARLLALFCFDYNSVMFSSTF